MSSPRRKQTKVDLSQNCTITVQAEAEASKPKPIGQRMPPSPDFLSQMASESVYVMRLRMRFSMTRGWSEP